MHAATRRMIAIAAALSAAACSDVTNSSDNTIELLPAFETMPAGFSANSNSFDESADTGEPFMPEAMSSIGFHGGNGGDDDDHNGFGRRRIKGILMGGGLHRDFIGLIRFGRSFGHGPFGIFDISDRCTFDEATGRVTCPTRERHGFEVNVSFAFEDEEGTAQPKFIRGETDLVNIQTSVAGTKTRGNRSTEVDHASDRTIEGLAEGSTERTINGTAHAIENTTGVRDETQFTALREAYDTTTNLVIPIEDGHPTIPSSGKVIRRMRVAITPEGGEEKVRFRREEITFDGTNVIQVVITQGDVTKNCTITLPKGKLVCE